MLQARRNSLAVIAFSLLAMTLGVDAADPPKTTVVTVGEMCGGCVVKITARLEKMPSVGKIDCDIKTKTVTITPAAGKDLTAVAVWDAMAEIGKTPKKMVAPSGTFTSRPKS